MTHQLFRSVRVPSTVNQQDETITPDTKANCHDNRSPAPRVLPKEDASCNPPQPTRIPAKEALNTASDLIFDLPNLTEI